MPQGGWARSKIQEGRHVYVYFASLIMRETSLGDLQYKRFGITSEPDIRTKLLQGWVSLTAPHVIVTD